MTLGNVTPYDEISYPGRPYESTHPDHLGTLGALFGMDPALPEKCRVLELGCGKGGNLLPMAYQYPDSEFVGIDLSRNEIAQGLEQAARFGLRNVSLRQGDIAEVTADWGKFDFIVAHGVYAWVPSTVREAILAIIGANLTPQGIAYVSYNAHPGSHLRDLTRDIMNFHVHDLKDPKQKIAQARAILRFVAEGSDKTSVHGAVLRDQYERVSKMGDEVLFHDDLNEGSRAFLLHEVVADAKRHGLQYLCDASLSRRDLAKYPESVREVLERFPDEEFLARDQFQDFIDGHGFRRTLLCRADIKLQRKLVPDCIARFQLASSARPVEPGIDPAAPGIADFKIESGEIVASDHPLTKAALLALGRAWPAAISYAHLLAQARVMVPQSDQEDIEATTHALFTAVMRGHVTLHLQPPAIVTAVSERPEASLVARKQAEQSNLITNLQHTGVLLEDERVQRLLLLVDGTRDLDQLVAELKSALAGVEARANDPPIDRASVERHLKFLAGLALLVR